MHNKASKIFIVKAHWHPYDEVMTEKNKKDPVGMMFKALALTLLTIGGWLILTDEMEGKQGDVYREQAENFIFELKPVSAEQIIALTGQKKPALLMLHALSLIHI